MLFLDLFQPIHFDIWCFRRISLICFARKTEVGFPAIGTFPGKWAEPPKGQRQFTQHLDRRFELKGRRGISWYGISFGSGHFDRFNG